MSYDWRIYDEAQLHTKKLKSIEKTLEKLFNHISDQSKPKQFDKAELERNNGFMKMGDGLIAHITHHEDVFVTMHLFDFNLQIVTTSTDYGHSAATHVTKFSDMPSKAIQDAQRAIKNTQSL